MIGYIFSITGGMVSFGPPLGGVCVFAHECENAVDPMMSARGMSGSNLFMNFFILFLLEFCSCHTFDSLDVLELHDKVLKIVDIMHI